MKQIYKNFLRRLKKINDERQLKKNYSKKLLPQKNLDKKLVFSLAKSRLPNWKQLKHLPKFLSSGETKIIKFLLLAIFISTAFLGWQAYNQFTYFVPAYGGEYTEGLIGTPHYINPILAQTNDVDRDLTRLIFSSLLQYDEKQNLVPDLALRYEISSDQKTYTFYLRDNVFWHDGEKLNADDVIFTVKNIQDPQFKSPLANSLRGVSIKKIDNLTVSFTLEEPFAPFLEILTFGILPKHIWNDIPANGAPLAEYNIKPIGSGPFEFSSLTKDKLGNIKSITLKDNNNYYKASPFIKNLTFKFYPDFSSAIEALKNKNVEGLSFLPKELKNKLEKNKNLNYYSLQIPQYTAVFFNQKKNEALKDKEIRKALTIAVDKEQILNQALGKEGIIIDTPILPGYIGYNSKIKKYPYNSEEANKILDKNKWKKVAVNDYIKQRREEELKKLAEQKKEEGKKQEQLKKQETNQEKINGGGQDKKTSTGTTEEKINKVPEVIKEIKKTPEELIEEKIQSEINKDQPFFRKKDGKILEISLTTVDQPENSKAAELLKKYWQQIGFKVNINIVSPTEIRNQIIKDRNYEALLYAEIVGSDPDPYPFWHSSQNRHPGLNLAIFTNRRVDKLLEEARQTNNQEERRKKYIDFQNIIADELPAIFLYSPTYTYVVDNKVKGIAAKRLADSRGRFAKIEKWYIKTKRKFK